MNKRERIFQATRELLAEKGFHGLSMSVVAERAEVATGTIYRYFTDKDDLLRQLHHYVNAEAQAALFIDNDPEAPPFEQYRRFWINAFRLLTEDPVCLRCKAQYESSPHYATMKTAAEDLWQPLLDFFARGRSQGLFIDLPPKLLCVLSIDSVLPIASLVNQQGYRLDEQQKSSIILASWRAILTP